MHHVTSLHGLVRRMQIGVIGKTGATLMRIAPQQHYFFDGKTKGKLAVLRQVTQLPGQVAAGCTKWWLAQHVDDPGGDRQQTCDAACR